MTGRTNLLVTLLSDEIGTYCQFCELQNDFFSWAMEVAEGPDLSIKSLTTRLLGINIAAIHVGPETILYTYDAQFFSVTRRLPLYVPISFCPNAVN